MSTFEHTGFFGRIEGTPIKGCLLLLEDDAGHRKSWSDQFRIKGWDVYTYHDPTQAKDRLDADNTWSLIDVAVLDFDIAGHEKDGIDFAVVVKAKSLATTVILSAQTGAIPEHRKNELIRQRVVFDVFQKDDDPKDLMTLLDQLKNEVDDVRRLAESRRLSLNQRNEGFSNYFGEELQSTDERVRKRIAPSLENVLILGQTGTGKEEMAKRIHVFSGLAKTDGSLNERYRNFRVLNCAAFSDQLVLSQLFGHVHGAFTGADSHCLGAVLEATGLRHVEVDKRGGGVPPYDIWLKECARKGIAELKGAKYRYPWPKGKADEGESEKDQIPRGPHIKLDESGCKCFVTLKDASQGQLGGTLFLDEVAELSLYTQAALLRFLNGDGFHPLGYFGPPIRPSVRIIAATNRREHFTSERFRTDLFYRLNLWKLEMPPIHTRGDEPLRVAEKIAAELEPGTPNTFHQAAIGIDEDGLHALKDLLDGKSSAGTISSEAKSLRSGNYRSLISLIKRAAWIVATNESSEARPVITRAIIEEASQESIEIETAVQDKDDERSVTTRNATERLLSHVRYLQEDVGKGGQSLLNSETELEKDTKAVGLLREVLMERGGEFSLKKLVSGRPDPLPLVFDGIVTRERWCCIALLAVVSLSAEEYTVTKIARFFKHNPTTCSKHFKDAVEAQLLLRGMQVEWSIEGTRPAGPIAEYLGFVLDAALHPSREDCPDQTRKTSQFYCVEDIGQIERDEAYTFVNYLQRIAHQLNMRLATT